MLVLTFNILLSLELKIAFTSEIVKGITLKYSFYINLTKEIFPCKNAI